MSSNTHSAIIDLPNGVRAFIDGIPDQCEHDWNGENYNVLILASDEEREELWMLDSEIKECGYDLTKQTDQERFHQEGWRLVGGGVTCTKCKKPFQPDFFAF